MYNREDMICSFGVNDYHIAVIITPYIYEAINAHKNVVTFFDRNFEDIVNKVIQTNEKLWRDNEFFNSIDWKKLMFEKLGEKFENAKDSDVVIVVGKMEFVERINRLLINFHTKFTIVNCFYIEDIFKSDTFSTSKYGKILNTNGLQDNKKIDYV